MIIKKIILCFIFIFFAVPALCPLTVFSETDCANGEHVYRTEIRDATDTEPGAITYVCEYCGDTYTEEIPPYGHQFTSYIRVQPAENQEGQRVYHCVKCGIEYTEPIPALPAAPKEELPDEEEEIQEEAPEELHEESLSQEMQTDEEQPESEPHAEKEAPHVRHASVNIGDIMFGSIELVILAVLVPLILIDRKRIRWHRKSSEEYRKHHIKWKELS